MYCYWCIEQVQEQISTKKVDQRYEHKGTELIKCKKFPESGASTDLAVASSGCEHMTKENCTACLLTIVPSSIPAVYLCSASKKRREFWHFYFCQ